MKKPASDAEIEVLAAAAHEANRAYCLGLGDTSQPNWDDAPEWQKASARTGVSGALAGNTPEQSHESWTAHKVADGWIYGPVKDPDRKQHPCLVAYSDLPASQRLKDDIFITTVRGLAGILGVA